MYNEFFFFQILNEYRDFYGDESFNDIKTDIEKSEYSKELIFLSLYNKLIPSGDEFVDCVKCNDQYSFVNVDTILAASLVLFKRWLIVYSSENKYSEDVMIEIEREILKYFSQMNSDSSLPIMKEINMF